MKEEKKRTQGKGGGNEGQGKTQKRRVKRTEKKVCKSRHD